MIVKYGVFTHCSGNSLTVLMSHRENIQGFRLVTGYEVSDVLLLCVWGGFTLCSFTLPNQIGASGVAGGQQLPLCILSTQFTKVPAAITGQSTTAQQP